MMKRLRCSFLLAILGIVMVFPVGAQQPADPPSGSSPFIATPQPDITAQDYLFPNGLAPITDDQRDSAEWCIYLMENMDLIHRDGLNPDCTLVLDALDLADQPDSDEALETIAALARQNPSLLLSDQLMEAYFDRVPLVGPVTFSDSPLESVDISYQFTGNERFNAYELAFTDLDGIPQLTGYEVHQGVDEPVPTPDYVYQATPTRFEIMPFDAELVRALPAAFTDFIPVRSVYGMDRCEDYSPSWRVELTYTDGTEVSMLMYSSDVFEVDGPWVVYSNNERYFQYSNAIGRAMVALMESLDAPLSSREGIVCDKTIEYARGYFAQSYIYGG